MQKNFVYLVYVGYYDFVGDWVVEYDSAYFNEINAKDRINTLQKDDIKGDDKYWINIIEVL